MGNVRYQNEYNVTIHYDIINKPLERKKPGSVFAGSMTDFFHPDIPLKPLQQIFETIEAAKQHTFQILTKRSSRMVELAPFLPWPNNLWVGVSIESGKYIHRADNLRKIPAANRFLSIEPMIGPVYRLDLSRIDWVILGGESGPGAREMKEEWAVDVRDRCVSASIPFFFKQWGTFDKSKSGRVLQDQIWDQNPVLNK